MKLFRERLERIRITRPFAAVDMTGNLNDIVEVSATRARELIAANFAEPAPDAEVGEAPTSYAQVPCPACLGLNSEFSPLCQWCGRWVIR